MQLRRARVCLDCEELHEAPSCPACASESFAYLSRWVSQPAPQISKPPQLSPTAAAYRRLTVADSLRPKAMRLAKQGAVGFAVLSLARWLWREHQRRSGHDPSDGT
jgi:hypothetical protein